MRRDASSETAILFGAEWRRTLRSARVLVLLLLYGMFTLVVGLLVGTVSNALERQAEAQVAAGNAEQAEAALGQMRQGLLGFLFGADTTLLDALAHIPLVVLVLFKLTLVFLPIYVALMGFDQLSGEVDRRSIRFVTVRAGRGPILLGKFLGQAVVLLSLVLVVDAGIFAYARATHPGLALDALLLGWLRLGAAASIFSAAYVALTLLCSAAARAPALCLVLNVAALFGFWLLDAIGARGRLIRTASGGELRPWTEALGVLSPSHYVGSLLDPRPSVALLACGAYAVFSLVFLGAAFAVLRARDL